MLSHVYHHASLDSTNAECHRLAAQNAPDRTVVIADRQTAGRGRRGRSFESPDGLGLYLSILWRPGCTAQALLPLTSLAAVAAVRAIRHICAADCGIKWPNDIVLNGKKIAGILTETSLGESGAVAYVVLGIGINVAHTAGDFSPEVATIASSLAAETGRHIGRDDLAAALMTELDTLYDTALFAPQVWLAEYRRSCLTLGKAVQLLAADGTQKIARAVDIDPQFGLVVQYPNGETETVRSGEVSVRGLYGYAE